MTQADWGRKFELSSSQISARIKKGIGIGPRLRRKVAEHGTTGMYDNQNCRCDACKEAKHQADKARWQRHKQSDL